MAEGRGRPGGGSPVAGRRLLLLLLLPGALLSFLPQATPHPSVTHRYENVKAVEISVQPTAVEEVISGGKDAVEVQHQSKKKKNDIIELKETLEVF
ncbi:uncharacterized protein LOC131184643 isoform X4 [Ahaetulla prasina]|uniref:uncharacterized protein LOC131184643 isoform X4 n=1 Tax=Ahaetulla prasina TaxID=499056 RepID=UPI0026493ADC|nr:uncharacterized protein LOC131184643 isoform X4 [Ahaetulla prasina]